MKTQRAEEGQRARYWRSIEELEGSPEVRKWADDEFPERASIPDIDRRDFLKFLGASAIMASLAGCRNLPPDKIVPLVHAPEETVPGKSLYYATTFVQSGFGVGVLAESRQGRPIKLEGNERHPSSLGATDAITQAAIYGLYDPFRSQETLKGKISSTIQEFVKEFQAAARGGGVAILTETVTSPSLRDQIQRFLAKHPGSRWAQYEPVNRDNVFAGTAMAFGKPLSPVYRFDRADVVLSLDSDFLVEGPGHVRYAMDFSTRRRVEGLDMTRLNRLYAVESSPTLVGANADHRIAVKPSGVEDFARSLAVLLGVEVSPGGSPRVSPTWMAALVSDLKRAGPNALVVAGRHQPPAVHALAHALNAKLGAIGNTVVYTAPPERPESQIEEIAALVKAMRGGEVRVLLVLGGNPVYNAPADLRFAEALGKVPFSAHLGLYRDETAGACTWHIPESHFLESWGDALAHDGTASTIQPLIAPLYATITASELLELLSGGARKGRDILYEYWAARMPSGTDPERTWEEFLHDGLVAGTALRFEPVTLLERSIPGPAPKAEGTEAVLLPDSTIYDGRYANYPWLQELPKKLTSIVWDNTVQMSPGMAQSLGVSNGDLVHVRSGESQITGAVLALPGHADDTVTLHLGYGRVAGAPLMKDAELRGFDAYPLRTVASPWIVRGVEVSRAGGRVALANTQTNHVLDERFNYDIVRSGTVEEIESNPSLTHDEELDHGPLPSLYDEKQFAYDGYKWAMTIDLSLCIGCGACTAACQAENNIPVVGKYHVIKGREMHWIRVDRYFKGSPDAPEEVVFQPVPCMNCENAPCEPVCPVGATTHSKEGLNQMVYNRCVGTRYCSNNCPYKVRRFNYVNFADKRDYPSLTLLNNPDVTVRGRGVMEKCTYCVQRINVARIESKKRGTPIRDGEIVTACQQACPTRAIVFGDLSKPENSVSKSRGQPRTYALLRELNTRPRTTYLTRVRNPNPDILKAEVGHGA